jgi:response regulator RpfG family c-di-GMP phosphodiesterase
VAASAEILSARDVYILEVAALLHEFGKIGLPDVLLLKETELTSEEHEFVQMYERLGADLIRATLNVDLLDDILRQFQRPFAANPETAEQSDGDRIPLAARILRVADEFDDLVTNRFGEPIRSHDEAFQVLRDRAGQTLDPGLVERFIQSVQDRDRSRTGSPDGGEVRSQFVCNEGTESCVLQELRIISQQLHGHFAGPPVRAAKSIVSP